MKEQNVNNHIRFYTPHHFVFYPVMLLLLIGSGYHIFAQPENRLLWVFIFLTIGAITWLSFMTRQHYALSNQNRVVRLELRLRYYILMHEQFEPYEEQLSFGQLAALRFASDEELPALLKRAINENMSPAEIKKSIKNWLPDYMRV